jgi:phosphoribosyl 1,2-cyclic phosphate phosphodiesterase
VEVLGRVFCLDAGPDFRQQMLRAHVQRLDAVLLTHKHKDHIAGLDDVRAFNFKYEYDMPIWADADTQQQIRAEYPYVFTEANYPGIPRFDLRNIEPYEVLDVLGIPVQCLTVLHGRMPVQAFRIGDFAYLTDLNHLPDRSRELLQGLDVLVLDALRHEAHPTHLNLEQALQLVQELQPRQAYFTHISHLMGPHAEVQAQLPAHAQLGWDGLTFETPDPPGIEPWAQAPYVPVRPNTNA